MPQVVLWKPLWGRFGPSWGLFWASWGPLLGLLGPAWGLLGASWGLLGASWGPLGSVLGASWGRFSGPPGNRKVLRNESVSLFFKNRTLIAKFISGNHLGPFLESKTAPWIATRLRVNLLASSQVENPAAKLVTKLMAKLMAKLNAKLVAKRVAKMIAKMITKMLRNP